MNEVMTFTSEDFGPVRTVEVGGKILFCGKDVASVLGYANANDAMKKHCKSDDIANRYPIVDSIGRTQKARFLSEGDVYRLIAHSKLPSAEKIESWFFDEIIPSVIHTGKYDIENSDFISKKDREKSKEVRKKFTGTLKEHGYTAKHEYIQTTVQMKKSLGITCKKDQMDKKELLKVEAAEVMAQLFLTTEYGFNEVNPVCVEAAETVESSLEAHNSKHIA